MGRVCTIFMGFVAAVVLCLAPASQGEPVAGDAGGRIDATTYRQVVDENLELRKEQAKLAREGDELRRKNAALLLDIQEADRKRDQLTALMSQLKTPDETKSAMVRLEAEKLVLAREVERLRVILAGAPPPTNTPPPVVPAAGSDLFRKLEKENAELRQALAKARESTLNESVAGGVLAKSEAVLKAENERLAGEVADGRRREDVLKQALEAEARKTYKLNSTMKQSVDEEVRKSSQTAAQMKQAAAAEARKAYRTSIAMKKAVEAEARKAYQASKKMKEVQAAKPGAEGLASQSVSALLDTAVKALAAGNALRAEQAYLQALKEDSDNSAACYNLGVLYSDYMKNPKKARQYFRRYLKLAPDAADAPSVRVWVMDLESKSDW